MNFEDTLGRLWRRWYIAVPGLILTIAVAIGAWVVVKPDYERTATQLLLPGTANIPTGGNPYLYLGGLSQAADVLVTAMSSKIQLDSLAKGHPGSVITVSRDPLTSGPQILIKVTSRTDAESGEILNAAIASTAAQLSSLQDVAGITAGNRIRLKSVSTDTTATEIQRARLLIVASASLATLLITLFVAGLVDGLSARKRRDRDAHRSDDDGSLSTDDIPDHELDSWEEQALLGSRETDSPGSQQPVTPRRPLDRTR